MGVTRWLGAPGDEARRGGNRQSDIDNLLAGYRAARAQQALFEPRGGAVTGYDEFVDAAGNVRPSWVELAECVGERGRGGLEQLRSVMRSSVDNDGITYIQRRHERRRRHQRRRHGCARAVAPRRVCRC